MYVAPLIARLCLTATLTQTAPADARTILQRELQRSRPDYIAFVPGSLDGSTHDNHNEHFLVFESPRGPLMAVWTQSLTTPGPRNRIVFSRSDDDGVTWAPPTHVAGPRHPDDPANMASWGFPLVSRRGRIYVVYNQNQGTQGWIRMHTGTMDAVYSDDDGKTWSAPQTIPMPRSPYDDPTGRTPAEWIVWQVPMRDKKGGWFVTKRAAGSSATPTGSTRPSPASGRWKPGRRSNPSWSSCGSKTSTTIPSPGTCGSATRPGAIRPSASPTTAIR